MDMEYLMPYNGLMRSIGERNSLFNIIANLAEGEEVSDELSSEWKDSLSREKKLVAYNILLYLGGSSALLWGAYKFCISPTWTNLVEKLF